jgi:RNA polymerase sigma factor (TIGR02999 family)
MEDFTVLLHRWREGDHEAENQLFEQGLPHLRRLAHWLMQRERDDHTVQPTALVNEAFLRLVRARDQDWQNRQHFFAIAARVMRRYLIDYARGRNSAEVISLPEGLAADATRLDEALDVDRHLERLAAVNPEWSRVVEVKYFLGLTDEEAAEALQMKLRSFQRAWSDARAWLHEQGQRNRGMAGGA